MFLFKINVACKNGRRNLCILIIFKSLNLEGKESAYVLLRTQLRFSAWIPATRGGTGTGTKDLHCPTTLISSPSSTAGGFG